MDPNQVAMASNLEAMASDLYGEGRYKLHVKFNRCYVEVAVDASKFRVSHAV